MVLLSGLGCRRTHPVGAEGATMAWRAPFPLSSIPAYIDQSMKLFVCLNIKEDNRRYMEILVGYMIGDHLDK